jgi:hypothetical protein
VGLWGRKCIFTAIFISNPDHTFPWQLVWLDVVQSQYQNTIQYGVLFSWSTLIFSYHLFIGANPSMEIFNKMKSIVQLKRMVGHPISLKLRPVSCPPNLRSLLVDIKRPEGFLLLNQLGLLLNYCSLLKEPNGRRIYKPFTRSLWNQQLDLFEIWLGMLIES